jgi:cysteine desulfurase
MKCNDNSFIYLDNAAAAMPDIDLLKNYVYYAENYYANPEGGHNEAIKAKNALNEAAVRISETLINDRSIEVFWTHSATEAINIVRNWEYLLEGDVLTSSSEHPAITASFGKITNCVKTAENGLLDLRDLELMLNSETKAFIIHHIQNETGAIEDLLKIRQILNEIAPNALFIVDTVQSIGKVEIPWNEAGIDIAFCGGHKIGVPTGGAILYKIANKPINEKFNIYLKKLRSIDYKISRPDTPVSLTLADALCKAIELLPQRLQKIQKLNLIARKKLGKFKNIKFLIDSTNASPYILSFVLPDIQAEVLVRIIGIQGLILSAGSACKAASNKVSEVVLAMGLSKDQARSVIRLSFGFFSNEQDIEFLFENLNDALLSY